MTNLFFGGSPISLDLTSIFGSTLEPSEALLLNTFLKFDENDDGLLQLHEIKKAFNYIGLPGTNMKEILALKNILEIDLKTFVLIVKFLLVGADEGEFNEKISVSVAQEIFKDANLVFNIEKDYDQENIEINEFIDKIQENTIETTSDNNQ